MAGSTVTATARRHFDQAVSVLEAEPASACRLFREATELDPSMADAWLGRIAAGDNDFSTLENLFAYGARLHRESNRLGLNLAAAVRAGPYLSITVTEACLRHPKLEELGFCDKGDAKDFIADGAVEIGGRLPINTHGGQLGEAYIHGMNGIAEGVRQLRGTSVNQVGGVEHVLVTAGTGVPTSGLILG